jgi:hypothetical protein
VTPLHKTLITLLYLRHNVSHTVVGALFGFSADASEDAFAKVLPVLRDLFPKEKWESAHICAASAPNATSAGGRRWWQGCSKKACCAITPGAPD